MHRSRNLSNTWAQQSQPQPASHREHRQRAPFSQDASNSSEPALSPQTLYLLLLSLVFILFYKEQHRTSINRTERKLKLLQWDKKSIQQLFLRWTLHSGRQRQHPCPSCTEGWCPAHRCFVYFSKLSSFQSAFSFITQLHLAPSKTVSTSHSSSPKSAKGRASTPSQAEE